MVLAPPVLFVYLRLGRAGALLCIKQHYQCGILGMLYRREQPLQNA